MQIPLFHLAVLYTAFRKSNLTKMEYNSWSRFAEAIFEAALGNSLYIRHLLLLTGNKDYNQYFKWSLIVLVILFSVICYYSSGRIKQIAMKVQEDKDFLLKKWGIYFYYILSVLLIFIL